MITIESHAMPSQGIHMPRGGTAFACVDGLMLAQRSQHLSDPRTYPDIRSSGGPDCCNASVSTVLAPVPRTFRITDAFWRLRDY
jgi:hypothetical protein